MDITANKATRFLRGSWFAILPMVLLAWTLLLLHLSGPFYLTRTDPEYIYLLNGLNAGMLRFDRLGHFCHPGTPFQWLTGLFIQITYIVIGKGPLVVDVISRPELYLYSAALQLALMTSLLLWWMGRKAYHITRTTSHALIFQAGAFLSLYLFEYANRYMPDRLLQLLVWWFCLQVFRYLYDETYSIKRLAWMSGIILGLGLVTKVHFLPLLIIPVFILDGWKSRFLYLGVLSATVLVTLLPIINHLKDFWLFISDMAGHDGLYGSGETRFLNPQQFIENIRNIITHNIAFSTLWVLGSGWLGFILLTPGRWKQKGRIHWFLLAFLLASVLGAALVAKHYKDFYLLPVVSMNVIVFYVIYRRLQNIIPSHNILAGTTGVLVLLILVSLRPGISQAWNLPDTVRGRQQAVDFLSQNVPDSSYILTEPTWISGPYPANGLVYGVSYVTHKHVYFNEFTTVYPNILTWEGQDKPFRQFRLVDVDMEALFRSGQDIYTYYSPGRMEDIVGASLVNAAAGYDVSLRKDSVFFNASTKERIFRYQNISNWFTVAQGVIDRVSEVPGGDMLPISNNISGITSGDYLSVQLQRSKDPHHDYTTGRLIISTLPPGREEGILAVTSNPISNTSEKLALLRILIEIPDSLTVSKLYLYFDNRGNTPIHIKPGHYRLYRQKKVIDMPADTLKM